MQGRIESPKIISYIICYNKNQTRRLINNRNLFLTILEAEIQDQRIIMVEHLKALFQSSDF